MSNNCLCAPKVAAAASARLPGAVRYVSPAVAREPGSLPGPTGHKVGGRLLAVVPGEEYRVFPTPWAAAAAAAGGSEPEDVADCARAVRSFKALLSAAQEGKWHPRFYDEFCQHATHENGHPREEAGVDTHGTNMPDLMLVALGARPAELLGATTVARRLALVAEDERGPSPL